MRSDPLDDYKYRILLSRVRPGTDLAARSRTMIPNLRTMQPLRVPHTTRWRDCARGLAFAISASVAAVGLVLPTTANAEPPVLGPIKASAEYSGEETIEAQIDPGPYETVWTIRLDCPGQRRCRSTEGRLPADDESHTVTFVVTGLETDTHYQYTVEASSLAGATSLSGEFESIPAGACPKGCVSGGTPYRPPELPWANQSGNEAAERTVREQREKEHDEQKAKEAVGHAAEEAEALKRREEEAARQAAGRPKTSPACVVPRLKGDTLAVAHRALAVGHCRLGIVHRPVRQHGTLRVRRQSARAGKRLAEDARVALWIEARSDTRRACCETHASTKNWRWTTSEWS
jgi:hypothetical protein